MLFEVGAVATASTTAEVNGSSGDGNIRS